MSGTSRNPPCEECGGKTQSAGKVTTRDGKKQKWHCTVCGHYITEDSHKPRFTYNFGEHPYTIVVVE